MQEYLLLEEFLTRSADIPVIDVRSPSEFIQGHIPGAVNLPLLDDEMRKKVGIAYKKQGRQEAVRLGFELAGPFFHEYVSKAKKISPSQDILVHCWRGGMRSSTMAWILALAGFKTAILKSGYKVFRHWALDRFSVPGKLLVLGGKTGSGKTEVLEFLQAANEQVINLEGLANHKGSAFGALGQKPQPSNEQFENELAWLWHYMDKTKTIWIESESLQVGSNLVPAMLFARMRSAPVVEMMVDKQNRAVRILKEYGNFPADVLAATTLKLQKRLGIQRTTEAVTYLKEGKTEEWLDILLDYYDKLYQYSVVTRNARTIFPVNLDTADAEMNARSVLSFAKQNMEKMFLAVDEPGALNLKNE